MLPVLSQAAQVKHLSYLPTVGIGYFCGILSDKQAISSGGWRPLYDHTNGTLMIVKPRQLKEMKKLHFETNGFMVWIRKDYLNGHHFHQIIQQNSLRKNGN